MQALWLNRPMLKAFLHLEPLPSPLLWCKPQMAPHPVCPPCGTMGDSKKGPQRTPRFCTTLFGFAGWTARPEAASTAMPADDSVELPFKPSSELGKPRPAAETSAAESELQTSSFPAPRFKSRGIHGSWSSSPALPAHSLSSDQLSSDKREGESSPCSSQGMAVCRAFFVLG